MAYCSVDDLKGFGYNITEADEANMATLCDIASAKVDAYCHRRLQNTKGQRKSTLSALRMG